jgi:DNA-binding NarL/FixJ family response regulator
LPDGSGISIIQKARKVWPTAHIMVSTVFGDEAHVIQAIEAGASGYVLKDNSSETLIQEIRQLHAGGSPISPIIARLLLRRFQAEAAPTPNNPAGATSILSPREAEVLQLMTKGFSYSEIARLMDVRLHTIHTFVRRMYAKLDVNNKTEAIHEARLMGLLDD